MKKPTLCLLVVASLFIAAGFPGLINTAIGGPAHIDPTAVGVIIGVGLLLRQRVARWGAIMCLCGAYAFGGVFLFTVLTSRIPRTVSWEEFVLPPAAGYLVVIGYLVVLLVLAAVAHAMLLRRDVGELFLKKC